MALNPADGTIAWLNNTILARYRPPIIVDRQLLYDDVLDETHTDDYQRGAGSLDPADGSVQWISPVTHAYYSLAAISEGTTIRQSTTPNFVSDR